MSDKYTAEALEVVTVLEGTFITLDGGGFIARMEDNGWGDPAKHARRIVACVNACAGIPTEALALSYQFQVDAKMSEIEAHIKTAQQRDQLLEALKTVIADKAPGYHDCVDDGEAECAWCIARKAIAAARGEQ